MQTSRVTAPCDYEFWLRNSSPNRSWTFKITVVTFDKLNCPTYEGRRNEEKESERVGANSPWRWFSDWGRKNKKELRLCFLGWQYCQCLLEKSYRRFPLRGWASGPDKDRRRKDTGRMAHCVKTRKKIFLRKWSFLNKNQVALKTQLLKIN